MPTTAICRECGYPLQHLPDHRCPECGRAFDPADPMTYYRDAGTRVTRALRAAPPFVKRTTGLAVCVAICWTLHLFGDFSLLFWLPALYLLLKVRPIELLVFLLVTPLSVEFFSAARDYASGSPRYANTQSMFPRTPQGSINRVTRIRGHDPGCGTRAANAWVRSSAEHLAGSVMFRLIGPPRGAYTGPYPTEAQALSAVATGTPVSAAMLASDQLIAAGVTLQIDPYWFRCQYQERRPEEPADPNVDATPRASLWQARCLIVRIPRDMPMGQAAADVYLIDVQRPELFALFWDRTPPPSPPSTK